MTTVIIDYGAGNLRSAHKAFEKISEKTVIVTSDPKEVHKADRIVLPGVGAFGDCINSLSRLEGMIEALTETVITQKRPFMGICVGMQLMADEGREHGIHKGLGWIPGVVERIKPTDDTLKIPHMGWNNFSQVSTHPLLSGVSTEDHVYYVHSNSFKTADDEHCLAISDYSTSITAAIGHENMVGTQFHPEKSQSMGQHIIKNFLEWKP